MLTSTHRLNHVVCCNFGYGMENLEFNVQSFYRSVRYSTSNKIYPFFTLCVMLRDDETLLYLDDAMIPRQINA